MHCILFMADSARNYLCIDVIMHMLSQTTLNRKWFVQKLHIETPKLFSSQTWAFIWKEIRLLHNFNLFIEALFWFMNKNDCFSMLIKLWAASPTHHLQYIRDGKINISLCFSIIIFCSLQKKQSFLENMLCLDW